MGGGRGGKKRGQQLGKKRHLGQGKGQLKTQTILVYKEWEKKAVHAVTSPWKGKTGAKTQEDWKSKNKLQPK